LGNFLIFHAIGGRFKVALEEIDKRVTNEPEKRQDRGQISLKVNLARRSSA